jgi:hypothetical protein
MVVDVMKYLTDRAHGRPVQMIAGDPNKPVSIQLNWPQSPEWLQPNVTLNQVHITTSTSHAEEIRQVIDGQTRLQSG